MAERIRIGPDGTIIRENMGAPRGRVSAPDDSAAGTETGSRAANGYNLMRHSRYSSVTSAASDGEAAQPDIVFDTDVVDAHVVDTAAGSGLLHSPPFFYVVGILLCGLIALIAYALLEVGFVDTLSYRGDADWWQNGFASLVPPVLAFVVLGRGLYFLYHHHQEQDRIVNRDYLRLLRALVAPLLLGSLAALATFFLLPLIISIAKVALALGFLALFFFND